MAGSGRGLSGAACPAPAEGRERCRELLTAAGPGEGRPLRAPAAREPRPGRGELLAGSRCCPPGQDGPPRPYLPAVRAGRGGGGRVRDHAPNGCCSLPPLLPPGSADRNSNRRRVPGPAGTERDRRLSEAAGSRQQAGAHVATAGS